jgi:hypothetical protein
MANAILKTEEVEVKTIEKKNTGVTLELTAAEAVVLRDILYQCEGDPFTSNAKHSRNMFSALAGVVSGAYFKGELDADPKLTHPFNEVVTEEEARKLLK